MLWQNIKCWRLVKSWASQSWSLSQEDGSDQRVIVPTKKSEKEAKLTIEIMRLAIKQLEVWGTIKEAPFFKTHSNNGVDF